MNKTRMEKHEKCIHTSVFGWPDLFPAMWCLQCTWRSWVSALQTMRQCSVLVACGARLAIVIFVMHEPHAYVHCLRCVQRDWWSWSHFSACSAYRTTGDHTVGDAWTAVSACGWWCSPRVRMICNCSGECLEYLKFSALYTIPSGQRILRIHIIWKFLLTMFILSKFYCNKKINVIVRWHLCTGNERHLFTTFFAIK